METGKEVFSSCSPPVARLLSPAQHLQNIVFYSSATTPGALAHRQIAFENEVFELWEEHVGRAADVYDIRTELDVIIFEGRDYGDYSVLLMGGRTSAAMCRRVRVCGAMALEIYMYEFSVYESTKLSFCAPYTNGPF